MYLCLTGCSPQHEERRWRSRGIATSPYSATLTETDYNHGESNAYQLRVDASAHGDDGWFFVDDLATDLITSPKPDVRWASPNDLIVSVHTAKIEGQTRRRFGNHGRPLGSLTVRYLPDQPDQ